MNILLTGSSALSEFDKIEIKRYLENYLSNQDIHLMCYRSIESEVLAFFIENEEYAEQLHLYSFQPLDNLAYPIKESVQYLKEKGAKYQSFNTLDVLIKRSTYEQVFTSILQNVDVVISFFNHDKPTALIPVDIASNLGIDAFIYPLPGYDESKLDVPIVDKLILVEKKQLNQNQYIN